MSGDELGLLEPESLSLPDIVDGLPAEITIKIFGYCLPNHKFPDLDLSPTQKAPLVLSHVCSSWRTFVDGSPMLWRSFSFSACCSWDYGPARKKYVLENLFALWDTKSKHSLRELFISIKCRTDPNGCVLWGHVLSNCLLPNASSLRVIKLYTDVYKEKLADILPKSLPNLEELDWWRPPQELFDSSDDNQLLDKIWDAPNIHSLGLAATTIPLDIRRFRIILPWKNIRSLTVFGLQRRKTLYAILEECERLEYLSIRVGYGYQPSDNDTNSPPRRQINAERLEQLKISFSMPANPSFFYTIAFPALTSFRMCDDPARDSERTFSFNTFTVAPFDGFQNLRSLTLSLQNLTTEKLIKILEVTPLLADLCVESHLRQYDTVFKALQTSPALVPMLEHLELYIRLSDTPSFRFTKQCFLDMVRSRVGMTPPRNLRKVILFLEKMKGKKKKLAGWMAERERLGLREVEIRFHPWKCSRIWLNGPPNDARWS